MTFFARRHSATITSNGYRDAFFSKLGFGVVDHLSEQLVVSFHHLSMFAWGPDLQLNLPAVKPLRDFFGR
jgi:hypothetical protein